MIWIMFHRLVAYIRESIDHDPQNYAPKYPSGTDKGLR